MHGVTAARAMSDQFGEQALIRDRVRYSFLPPKRRRQQHMYEGYTKLIPNKLLLNPFLSFGEHRVLMVLLTFAALSVDSNQAYPSLNTIMGYTNMSLSGVRKALNGLEAIAAIKRFPRGRAPKRQGQKPHDLSNLYVIELNADLWDLDSRTESIKTKDRIQKRAESEERRTRAKPFRAATRQMLDAALEQEQEREEVREEELV